MATLDRLAPPPSSARTVSVWSPRRAIAAAAILAAAIAVLQVFQSSGLANTGEELSRLERQRTDTAARVHDLEAEVAALSSLDRTEIAARERLGMVPAGDPEYLQVAVPGPSGPLLPALQPRSEPEVAQPAPLPWWQRLLRAAKLF